jgi:hypothetical protein
LPRYDSIEIVLNLRPEIDCGELALLIYTRPFVTYSAQTQSSCMPAAAAYWTPVRVYWYSNASSSATMGPSGNPPFLNGQRQAFHQLLL